MIKFLLKNITYVALLFLVILIVTLDVTRDTKAVGSDTVANTAYLKFQKDGQEIIVASNQVKIVISKSMEKQDQDQNQGKMPTTSQTKKLGSGAPPKTEKNLTGLLMVLLPMALLEILIIILLIRRRIKY